MRSSFMFSKDRRSPSSRAIRACQMAVNAQKNGQWEQENDEPASLHVQSPIHFCRVRNASILFASSGERMKEWNPVRSGAVEVEFDPVGIGAAAGVAAAAVDFVADDCWVGESPTWVRDVERARRLEYTISNLHYDYKYKQIEIQQPNLTLLEYILFLPPLFFGLFFFFLGFEPLKPPCLFVCGQQTSSMSNVCLAG